MLLVLPLILALTSVANAEDGALALVRDADGAGKIDIVSLGTDVRGMVVDGARGRDKPDSLVTCANALQRAARGGPGKPAACAKRYGMTADSVVSAYEIRILGYSTDKEILEYSTDKEILELQRDKKTLRFVPLVALRADGAAASAVLSGSFHGYTVRQYASAKATYAVVGCTPGDHCSSLGINHPEEVVEIKQHKKVTDLQALAADVHGHVVKQLSEGSGPSRR